ncbi:WhiB family transcriptional regulator [Rhodococcus qingshengii]|uniref:WhiB family transcriptional regulator n=1 Tax=Rhodococcus qingshengii TaxID=334542 RepID=UPI0037C6282F
MGGVVKAPTDEQIAETIAELDRLGVPVTATLAEARAALRNADSGTSTDRLRSAVNRRKAAAGLTPRNSEVSKSRARRTTERTNSTERTRATELALSVLIDPRLFGAACVGHHDLFDAAHHGERWADGHARHEAAAQICRHCPVFAACDEVANENPRSVAGVWAGRVRSNSRSSKGS